MDNDNENSIDPNPYAYPYFHNTESMPLLYSLIVTHFGNTSSDNSAPATTANATDGDVMTSRFLSPSSLSSALASASTSTAYPHLQSEKTILARRRKFIARRIQSRFQRSPQEAKWVDSCGETALFRFCQLIRFQQQNVPTRSLLHPNVSLTLNDCQNHLHHYQNMTTTSLESTDDLIFFVFHCFLEMDSNVLNTLNKWGETPLHQFASHCGFDCHNKNSCKVKSNAHANIKTHYNHDHAQGLSYLFLECMLKENPNSIHQTNFQQSLPLHLACSLSQFDSSQPFSSSDAMIPIQNFVSSDGRNKNNGQQTQHPYHEDHFKIVQRLVEYYQQGVLAIDMNGCTPLFRAVDSIHCSANVVTFLLSEMETLFLRTERDCIDGLVVSVSSTNGTSNICNAHNYCDPNGLSGYGEKEEGEEDKVKRRTASRTRFLFHKAIMGFNLKIPNKNNYRHQVEKMKTKNEIKQVLSPLELVWKTVLVQRQVRRENGYATPWLPHGVTSASIADVIESALMNDSDENNGYPSRVAEKLTEQLGDLWRKMMLLICCTYHGTTKVKGLQNETDEAGEKHDLCAVHAAIYCAAPPCILKLLVRLYPKDLLKRDRNGNTPLMLSILASSFEERWVTCTSKSNRDNHSLRDYSNLKYLLEVEPEAAAISNGKNRLPLHLAIQNNIQWDEGLEALFKANPSASSVQDPKKHLLPFTLASSSESYPTSLEKLRNTYMILRADPSIVASIYNKR